MHQEEQRAESRQRAGSVPGAELQPLLPVSKKTSLAAAQEPPPAPPAGRDLSRPRDARRNRARRDAVAVTLCLHAGEKFARCRSPGLCVTGAGWGGRQPPSFEFSGSEETDIDYPWAEEPSSCRPVLPIRLGGLNLFQERISHWKAVSLHPPRQRGRGCS